MNILQVYELQAKRAKERFSDVVSEAQILRLASGEPLKLRLEIVDGSEDILRESEWAALVIRVEGRSSTRLWLLLRFGRKTAKARLYVFWWGMPANSCPATTGFDDVRMIHVQDNYNSTSYRGQANDFAAIFTPAEVLLPLLSAWMV